MPLSSGTSELVSLRDRLLSDPQTRSSRPLHAPVNGGLVVLALPDAPLALPLRHQDRPVWVGQLDADGPRVAVVGLALQSSGEQQLLDADGRLVATWQVAAMNYPEQRLVLKDTRYVTPDPQQLERFAREAALQKRTYLEFSGAATGSLATSPDVTDDRQARWPTFRWPLTGRLSSPFGLQRFFNDVPRAPHLGLDIAGRQGAPVVAPADGRVALTGDFFFNGRTVIIDHGQGLFSMLCHFDRIRVNAGDRVRAGDVIATVGASGRATGPHLHWTVSLNDARIDPRWLLMSAN